MGLQVTTDFRAHPKFSKRMYHAFKPLWWSMHIWDLLADIWIPKFSFGFGTLTKYPDANPESTTVDGTIRRYAGDAGEAWSTLRNGAGTDSYDTYSSYRMVYIGSSLSTTDTWKDITRAIFLFDTSALTSGATILSAIMSIYGYSKDDGLSITPNVDIYTSTPTSNTGLQASDYSQLGSTSQTGSPITYANWSISGYNAFTLDSTGRGNISKTGVSKFGTRNANYDVADVAPTWAANNNSYLQCYFAEATGTSQDPKLVITYTIPFTNPTNAYSSNDTYATCTADTGKISVQLSKDGGSNYHNILDNTYTGSEEIKAFGSSTELWGTSWDGTSCNDTNFRVKVMCGSGTEPSQIYKTFGFSFTGTVTGIEVDVEAKWDGTTTSIDHIKVKIWYGTSVLTVNAGAIAYASNGRKAGEGAGAGTGVQVFYDGSNWIAVDTGGTVAA